MERTKTWMVAGCLAAGTMLGGCSTGQIGQMMQWASDAVEVSVEAGLDGEPRFVVNVNGERAAAMAQQRKFDRMQDLYMPLIQDRFTERALRDEQFQERLMQMIADRMFPDSTGPLARRN